MIFDNTLLFSSAQAITATAPSTNIVDLGATQTPFGGRQLTRDIGKGYQIPLWVSIGATFNNLTSLRVTLESDSTAGFASPKELGSRTYLLAELTAGKVLEFPAEIPEGANEQFIRLNYTVTGTAPSTGNVTAGVVAARQTSRGDHY